MNRVEEVRALIATADELRSQARAARKAAGTLTCGLDVKAGTFLIPSRFHRLMAAALEQEADARDAEADTFEARL